MRRWAAAVLIVVSGALMVVPGTADAAVPACGDVLFVGAAGSGEKGMGAEVSAVLRDVRAAAPQRRIASYPLPYRAASVTAMFNPVDGIANYMASLIEGESLLNTFLLDRVRKCPGERLVLAGYSQGAMVIHRSLQILGAAVTDRIDAVVLIGDGDRLPDDNVLSYGTAGTSAKGVGQWYPAYSQASTAKLGLTGRIFSVCNAQDIVCDHSLARLQSQRYVPFGAAIHLGYRAGPLLRTVSRLAAAALRKAALTVYRTSGRAGFVSYATGVACPAGTLDMRIVTQGAGQADYEGFFDDYLAPSSDIRIGTSVTAAPGSYTAYIGCQTGGRIVKTYQFTQTVNSPAPALGVSPAAARPEDRLTISAGIGCGAYTTSPQIVDVAVFDAARGGKPIVETTAAVTTGGQWGPVTLLLPAGSGTAGWRVSATCQAAAPDSPDQSYMPYPTVTVPAA